MHKFLIYTKLMRMFGNSDEKHTRKYLKILYITSPAELV